MTTKSSNGKSSTIIKRDRDFPFTGQSIECEVEYSNKTLEDVIELTGVHKKGGMGVVYKGISQKSGEEFAVKILDPDQEVENFEREAETAKRCSKKKGVNIVPTLAYGRKILTTSTGPKEIAYIVMPYIEHRNISEERLQINEVDEIALQLARTIEGIHEEGIIHRDINPKNIFVEKHGKTWLADLGLAKDTEEKLADETAAETIKGTPCYMSPEQARGENIKHKKEEKELFGKTDVYSFGSTLFKLVTGKTPFPAANATLTIKAVQEVGEPLDARKTDKSIPVTLNDIVQECTDPDAKSRPNAKEIKHEFEMRIESKKYSTKEERDKVLKATETRPKWYDWLIPAPIPGVIALYKLLKEKSEDREKLLRAHELASWITEGRTRRFHQSQVLKYYKQLNIMANKGEVPEDAYIIASIAERQLRKGPAPEITRQKVRGVGFGKKQAQKCLDEITDAGNIWLRGDIEMAVELRKGIDEEFKEVKKMKWREQVKPTYDLFNIMLDGSIKIQEAKKLLEGCKDYMDDMQIGMAEKNYEEAKRLLSEVPQNPPNPHLYSANSKEEEIKKLLKEENQLFRIKECIDSMKDNREGKKYDKAHIFSKETEDLIEETPISDRRRELKHEWREEKRLLKIDQGMTRAEELDKTASEDIGKLRYDLAQDKYDEIRRIIRQDLQEKECKEFIKEFEVKSENLRIRRNAMQNLNSFISKSKTEMYDKYKKDLEPVFERGDLPDSDEIRRFNEKIQEQLIQLGSIEREFVDERYDTVQKGLLQLYNQITANVKGYVQGKFGEMRSLVSLIKGEESSKNNKDRQADVLDLLDETRDVIGVINNQDLKEKLRAECKELVSEVRDQYDFAETVRRGRAAIETRDIDGAKREFLTVGEERQEEITPYLNIIRLEEEIRSNPEEHYEKVTETKLDNGVITGWRDMIERYKNANDTNIMTAMIEYAKEKIVLEEGEENPVLELSKVLEDYTQCLYDTRRFVNLERKTTRREHDEFEQSKTKCEELESEIDQKLNNFIEFAETYLQNNGQDYLKADKAMELGMAYKDAGFLEIAEEYFEKGKGKS